MAAGAILRVKKLRGAGIVRAAAAHNLRAIASELGAGGHIDASRCGLNVHLAGPETPAEVEALAATRMEQAGVGLNRKLRKDAVRALEFVVSLPPGQCADEAGLFASALGWLAGRFGGGDNILCADVHRDEAAPHMHALLLPLIGGRMSGSDAVGGRPQLQKLHADFFTDVCKPYGLTA